MKLHWLASAENDLAQVADHFAADNHITANAFELRILALAGNLVRFPEAGRAGRVTGTRELPIPGHPYILIYQTRQHDIVVLRILNASRQWPNKG